MTKAIPFILFLLLLAGCKPTEANYKSAYDAALGKRTQLDPDEALLYGGHKKASDLGAAEYSLGKDTLQVLYAPVILINADDVAIDAKFRVAVAFYRMESNALAHASRLRNEGLRGTAVAHLGDEKYLVIAHSGPNFKEAARWLIEWRKNHPDGPWIGLIPPEPILLGVPY